MDRLFEEIVDGSKQGCYSELLKKDELTTLMHSNQVFAGFNEASISFPPTFKLEKKERGICLDFCKLDAVKSVYKTKASDKTPRVPSWTDRILWYSLPLYKEKLEPTE